MTNQDRIDKAIRLLREGLAPFVSREMHEAVNDNKMLMGILQSFYDDPNIGNTPISAWDVAGLLKLMLRTWKEVFAKTLGRAEQTLAHELLQHRNSWAHQARFSSDDAYRLLDSTTRLLTAISAPESDDIDRMKLDLRREIYEEQMRSEKRKVNSALIAADMTSNLKPWRNVITPHDDVFSGRYQQAEFAADLWQVYLDEGSDEYRFPDEFFRRTFLTESLKSLLIGATQRLSGDSGDPVIQLQTNFGGGKTHSMLALYHLFGDMKPAELDGINAFFAENGIWEIPKVRRCVLVGTKISPGNPSLKPDGTMVRTLWGELAWQLGGKKAFARIALDDEKATNPGDVLRELFIEYGPCLILIDEWVAYARQLHDRGDLSGGTFETQFSFAQTLTESVKAAHNCLLVISLPAADPSDATRQQVEDTEVGGMRGREALDRLRNIVGRVETSWRSATAEEGFEIVRRRLFQPIPSASYVHRDVTARTFSDLYRNERAEFPPECHSRDYEERIRAAYPIHPEIFDRLYDDWSTLASFQRTRGVLRLMATVIHSLWQGSDNNPLILPATIPIDAPPVQREFTRYLPHNWTPIIEKDIDGANSLPRNIDGTIPNLGRISATRRVARTIFLGSAPMASNQHGLEHRRIKLGCVMPGNSTAVIGDALGRLASKATYLYQDGPRSWYSIQPTVTKLAEDRAAQLKRDDDKLVAELEKRLRDEQKKNHGDSLRTHMLPLSSGDVPDDHEARLVVLPADHPYSRGPDNPARSQAEEILTQRGNAPRQYRNALVFLAVDNTRLPDLWMSIAEYLAWSSIIAEKVTLDLNASQTKQAEQQHETVDDTVRERLYDSYRWLLVPEQTGPSAPITWSDRKLSGTGALGTQISKKLRNEHVLATAIGPTVLRRYLDDVPLWNGDAVEIRQLIDHFARYLYLPRLTKPEILVQTVRDGIAMLTWQKDTFGYAESYDEVASRYRGLVCGRGATIPSDGAGLLVKPEVAARQQDAENPTRPNPQPDADTNAGTDTIAGRPAPPSLRRFHGSARLDAERVGRDAGQIADAVIAHLAGQLRAEVTVTIEIEARFPDGADPRVVRTVTENCRTLKFHQQGFEEE